jgi:ribulose 1,5-bisphosphate synthetase/thiazole synthase
VLDDHLLAHRMQAGTGIGEQVFSDSLVAMREQARLDELQIRTEYDRQYAVSLAPNRDANLLDPSTNDSPIRNLFALCVEACVKNKINVSEALLNG